MNWSAIYAVFARHVLTLRRTPWGQNDLWVWPIIDVFLFGSVGVFLSGSMDTHSLQFHSVLLGVFMFSTSQVSGVSMSILFMDETRSRNVLNLIASPITTVEYTMGAALAAILRVAIAVGCSSLTCIVLYGFNPLGIGPGIVLVLAGLIAAGLATSLLLMALQLRIGDSADNMTWVIAIIPPSISGAIVPIAALPAVLQPLSHALPTAHAYAAARAILNEEAFPMHDFGVAAIGIGVEMVLFLGLSALCVRQFRARGLVTRYS
jgi:ABC-2 type transport system permease protein